MHLTWSGDQRSRTSTANAASRRQSSTRTTPAYQADARRATPPRPTPATRGSRGVLWPPGGIRVSSPPPGATMGCIRTQRPAVPTAAIPPISVFPRSERTRRPKRWLFPTTAFTDTWPNNCWGWGGYGRGPRVCGRAARCHFQIRPFTVPPPLPRRASRDRDLHFASVGTLPTASASVMHASAVPCAYRVPLRCGQCDAVHRVHAVLQFRRVERPAATQRCHCFLRRQRWRSCGGGHDGAELVRWAHGPA